MDRWRVNLLGRFELRAPDGQEIALGARKSVALLALLAAAPGQRLSRDRIATLLWEDMPEAQARGNLRQLLAATRRPAPFLEADAGSVGFAADTVETDLAELDAAVIAEDTQAALERAAEIYRADLLDGFSLRERDFEEWLSGERERLRERAVQLFLRLMQRAAPAGGEPAIRWALRILSVDPVHEPAHRALMELYAAQGRHAAALRQYEQLRDALSRELGTRPEPETDALARRIREDRRSPLPASGGRSFAAPAGSSPAAARADAPASPDPPPAPGRAVDRRAALPKPERRSRAGVFFRRHRRGDHDGLVAVPLAVRDRPQLGLHLQGPGGRRAAGRPRARRALPARRQRAQGGQSGAHHRAADRCRHRGASLGRPFRRHARGHFRAAGPGDRAASSGRSRRRWSRPRSTASSGSRPRASAPTITFCAAWRRIYRGSRERPPTRPWSCSTRRSSSTPISPRPTAWRPDGYCQRKTSGWIADREKEVAETARLARRAVELDKDDAVALTWGGFALAYVVRELDAGVAFIDRALTINPNLAAAWIASGWVRDWLGEPDLAIEHLARAARLSPLDPLTNRTRTATAHAHFFAGRYGEASAWAAMALREWPDFQTALRIAAASYALAGRLEEARNIRATAAGARPGTARFPI